MKKKILGWYLDPNRGYELREVEDDLTSLYELLDCSLIECPKRYIGGKAYVIICDEEGRLKGKQASAWTKEARWDGEPVEFFVGKLFIVNEDGEDFASLDEDDIKDLKEHFDYEWLDGNTAVCWLNYSLK